MKRCLGCGETKSIDSFAKHGKASDGRHPRCKNCHAEYQAAYRERNREARAAYQAQHRKPRLDYHRRWRAANPGTFKKYAITRHGITVEQFNRLVESQEGVCAICHERPERLCIDHDHSHCPGGYGCPECIRGLLCARCNIRDDRAPEDLWSAYLARPRPFAMSQTGDQRTK